MTPVSDLLDGLEAAAKAATPGPWRSEETGLVYPDHIDVSHNVVSGTGWEVATVTVASHGGVNPEEGDQDEAAKANAACIVAEHNAAPVLMAALRAVLALHIPSHGYCVACDNDRDTEIIGNNPDCPHHTSFCASCDLRWPCPTVRAIGSSS